MGGRGSGSGGRGSVSPRGPLQPPSPPSLAPNEGQANEGLGSGRDAAASGGGGQQDGNDS